MHYGMQYDPIQGQGQGQGHETLKVRNSAIFEGYLLPIYNDGWQMTTDSYIREGTIPTAYRAGFLFLS